MGQPEQSRRCDRDRREYRSLTIADLTVLVVGFAVALWLLPMSAKELSEIGTGDIAWPVRHLGELLAIAVAIAVIVRCGRCRVLPCPAEWLALTITARRMSLYLRDLGWSHITPLIEHVVGEFGFFPWLLVMASIIAATLVACLGFLHRFRRILPPWSKAVISAWIAAVTFWGLDEIIRVQLSACAWDYAAPALSRLSPAWLSEFCTHCFLRAFDLPVMLVFAIPAVATWRDRHWRTRRTRCWTEWGSIFATLLVAIPWIVVELSKPFDRSWLGEYKAMDMALDFAWWIVAGLLAWLAIRYFGPAWSRWIEPGYNGPERTPPSPRQD